ncbi:PREDICTED: uncharacterized protein LOC105570834 [Vollenhovia emeryi]|uniref:uncharacterized protein LOC105570834 n=1 Tax=Vollenhovia emeryi TaxID=411798 RepID=UPI0005F4299E|nr:PREDICTED: uncharacterized protein LOC105570834 [Vollenhovia emeryi]
MREPSFSPEVAKACDEEILRLLSKGAIIATAPSENQFLSSFFLVPKPSGGMRFILNLKDLNLYLSPQHFQLEDWRTVVQLMIPGSWMVTLDLEDAYLLLPIAQEYRHFLRFQWKEIVYEFTVLPFDDLLLFGLSEQNCLRNLRASMDLLSSLGFLLNYKKSQLIPAQRCKYLGFIFDSVQQSVAIPQKRRRNLLRLMLSISNKRKCQIRSFARMIGSLISVCPAVQYGLLYTKALERTKLRALAYSRDSYSATMDIQFYLTEDFQWWIRVFQTQNKLISSVPGWQLVKFSRTLLYRGGGASCGKLRTHGWWSAEEKTSHINLLEFRAAFYALQCFAPDLRDCDVLLRIDNTTAIACINRFGSVQYPYLFAIARQIWTWCENRNLMVFASYIASIENTIADQESRVISADTEWSLSEDAFHRLSLEFGPFDLDLFASIINAKCTAYVSWFPDPGAIAIDAFTLSWADTKFFAFPPFILLPRVLRKILNDQAQGVVVVPWWPSQSWFPLFHRLLRLSPCLEDPFPGGRTLIRQAFTNRGVPPGAIEATLASLSEATIKQYSKPLRDWWFFCQRSTVSLWSPDPTQFLNFLSQELKQTRSYSVSNTMRSAISLISDNEIGNHTLIRRFCKGVGVLKPPRPKYDYVWDPTPVLAKLASFYPHDTLPLKVLSKKLVLLLALGTGQRVQTLASFRISQILFNDKLIIRIPDRLKTSAPGRSQPLFCFSPFAGNENLCIFSLMKTYIEVTKDLRSSSGDKLFVSCTKPYRAVGPQTISRWIRSGLEECGVRTDLFTAHSIYKARLYLVSGSERCLFRLN